MRCGQLRGLVFHIFQQPQEGSRAAQRVCPWRCVRSPAPRSSGGVSAGGPPVPEKRCSGVVLRNNPHWGVSGERRWGSSQAVQAKGLLWLPVSEDNDGESK